MDCYENACVPFCCCTHNYLFYNHKDVVRTNGFTVIHINVYHSIPLRKITATLRRILPYLEYRLDWYLLCQC